MLLNKKAKLFYETSMVDIELMNNFLELIKSLNCTIILLGDYRQLPSISVGNLLYDLIFSEKIPSTELIRHIHLFLLYKINFK